MAEEERPCSGPQARRKGAWRSAFTVAELGAMLPKAFISWTDKVVGMECWLCDDRYLTTTTDYTMANTEADARAKMLVRLLESGQIGLS